MKKKSASTLIYFQDRVRKKSLTRRPHRVNKAKLTHHVFMTLKLMGLVTLGGILLWYYLTYHPLAIKNVVISGAERFVNKEDVRRMVEGKALNQNILFFKSKNIEEILANNFLAIKSAKLTKQLPSQLYITIAERVPIALVVPRNNGDSTSEPVFYFVDADGFILGIADKSTTNLPVITYTEEVEVGKFVEGSAVKYYFDLIKALDADNVAISTISSYPRYTEFYTKEVTQVLFTNDQDPKPQVKIFSKLVEAFKAEGKKLKKIDLRFDKVIVEFSN